MRGESGALQPVYMYLFLQGKRKKNMPFVTHLELLTRRALLQLSQNAKIFQVEKIVWINCGKVLKFLSIKFLM